MYIGCRIWLPGYPWFPVKHGHTCFTFGSCKSKTQLFGAWSSKSTKHWLIDYDFFTSQSSSLAKAHKKQNTLFFKCFYVKKLVCHKMSRTCWSPLPLLWFSIPQHGTSGTILFQWHVKALGFLGEEEWNQQNTWDRKKVHQPKFNVPNRVVDLAPESKSTQPLENKILDTRRYHPWLGFQKCIYRGQICKLAFKREESHKLYGYGLRESHKNPEAALLQGTM